MPSSCRARRAPSTSPSMTFSCHWAAMTATRRSPQLRHGQFGCTLAAHVCSSGSWISYELVVLVVRCVRYWLPQVDAAVASSQGRSWPIRSRLVRRYRRLCSPAWTGIGSRPVTLMPCRTRASVLSGLLVISRTLWTPRSCEDLRAGAVVAGVGGQAQLQVGVEGVAAALLELVRAQLGQQSDAAALVAAQVDDDAAALGL